MTTVQHAATPTGPSTARERYLTPIAAGLLIAAAGVLPWMWLAQVNARVRPDLPWAALATAGYLGLLVAWLNGWGRRGEARIAAPASPALAARRAR